MPINAFFRSNRALSTDKILVQGIQIKGISPMSGISEVLLYLKQCQQTHTNWLTHPIQLHTIISLGGGSPSKSTSTAATDINISFLFNESIELEDSHGLLDPITPTPQKTLSVVIPPEVPQIIYYYLEPSKALNTLFAQHGTLLQQIEYLELMGVTDAIARHPNLKVATNWHNFCKKLSKIGITNPTLELDATNNFIAPIKRLHLVHPIFLLDEEISSGLHISILKNTNKNSVLYVDSPETLELALTHCRRKSTLIIDGHWVHDSRLTHGVWENASAQEIGFEINRLFLKFPQKISAIRLLGCESGYLSSVESVQKKLNPQKIRFKSETTPRFHTKPMAEFRDRAIYYCQKNESPFAKISLVGQIIISLENDFTQISITAAPSYTYPFPTKAKKGQFNIGSNTPSWGEHHMWHNRASIHEPSWYKKLQMMKSITVIMPSKIKAEPSQNIRSSSAIDPLLHRHRIFKSKSCSCIDTKDNNTPGWPVKFK